jgi:hypothetical protein
MLSDDVQIWPKHVTGIWSNWHKMKISMRLSTYLYLFVKVREDGRNGNRINKPQHVAKMPYNHQIILKYLCPFVFLYRNDIVYLIDCFWNVKVTY